MLLFRVPLMHACLKKASAARHFIMFHSTLVGGLYIWLQLQPSFHTENSRNLSFTPLDSSPHPLYSSSSLSRTIDHPVVGGEGSRLQASRRGHVDLTLLLLMPPTFWWAATDLLMGFHQHISVTRVEHFPSSSFLI